MKRHIRKLACASPIAAACLLLAAGGCQHASPTRPAAAAAQQAESARATVEGDRAEFLAAQRHPAGRTQAMALFGELPRAPFGAGLPDPGENLRQVSFSAEGADFDPVLSPDGTRLYFSSTAHRPTPSIYAKSVDGRSVTQLTSDPASDIMPAVSPDGARIAFASDRSGVWNIYVMNATGGQAVQVTSENSHAMHPTWSPDGRSIAYCKLGEVSGRWEIWVTDADQPGAQRFLTYGLFPDWHPTSGRILFQRARDRGDRLFSIWTLDYTRGEATALTELISSPTSALVNPRWSRDGRFIAFASIPNPESASIDQFPPEADIWIMNASGGGLANITGGRFANLMPAWGPGNTVYFTSDRTGRQNIWSSSSEQALTASRSINPGTATAEAAAPARPADAGRQAPMNQNPVTRTNPFQGRGAIPAPAPAPAAPAPAPEIANVPILDDAER